MMDLSPKPHSDRAQHGTGKTFSGTGKCGNGHKWPVSWCFQKSDRFYLGRMIQESKQVVTPECCPTCSGKALTLTPGKSSRGKMMP